MNMSPRTDLPLFEVRFASLFRPGSGHAFPCDGRGRVDLDALSERARTNYLFARAMIGRENGPPTVCRLAVAEALPHH